MESSYQFTPYVWSVLATAVFMAAIGFYSWRHRSFAGATPFAIMSLLVTAGALTEAIAYTAGSETYHFWHHFSRIWYLPITVATLVFALQYAGHDRWLTRRVLTFLCLPPIALAVLIMTNDVHHWVWTEPGIDRYHRVVQAPGGWTALAFGLLLVVINTLILIGFFVRSPRNRWPVALILIGLLAPRICLPLFTVKPFLFAHPIPIFLTYNFTGIMLALALFRFHLFGIVPVARNKAIEQMRDGMLVLDAENRITDLNRAAQNIFGITRPKAIGKDVESILRSYPDLLRLISNPVSAHNEVSLGSTNPSWYRVNLTPLVYRNGLRLGQILLFDDITDYKKVQEQLLDQQRRLTALEERERLARELHDGVGQMVAAAYLQAEAGREYLERGDTPLAKASLNHLVRVTGEAKKSIREYLVGVKRGMETGESFFSGLRRYIKHYDRKYRIHTEVIAPPELEERGFDPKVEVQLQPIIIEALRNIRKHASARSAQIIFAIFDGQVQVTIEDDGRGFDPADLDGNEGFGLRSMRGRAESVGVRFDVNPFPGKGTKMFLHVPWRKEK